MEYLFLFNNQLTSLPETICDLNLDWDGISPANYPYFASGCNQLCDSDLIPDCVEYSSNFELSMDQNYYDFFIKYSQEDQEFSNLFIGQGGSGRNYGIEGGIGVFGAIGIYRTYIPILP